MIAAQSGQGEVGSNTKIPSELTVQKGLDGDKHPKIARIIVFYEDKTFDSYNPVE